MAFKMIRLRLKIALLPTAVLASLLGIGHAQSNPDPTAELKEMAVMSTFVEWHDWFSNQGLITGDRNPYGISAGQNVAITAIVRSIKRQLDDLQAEAPKLYQDGRGKEYFERRRAILLAVRARLVAAVSVASGQKLSAHLDALGSRLRVCAVKPGSKASSK